MRVRIPKRFTDKGNVLFGQGVIELDERTARRLIAEGKATDWNAEAGEIQAAQEEAADGESATPPVVTPQVPATPPPAPVVPVTPAVPATPPAAPQAPAASPVQALAQSDIPANFPKRQELILGGVNTVAALKAEGVKTQIDAIAGLTPEDKLAIGAALANLP